MNLNPNQYTSAESERAEAMRGCSKCGEVGHNARTCKGAQKPAEKHEEQKTGSLAPEGSRRLGRVDTLRDVNIYAPSGWDVKQSINYADSHPRNKGKWQIWRAPDGWIHVWHDDIRKVTEIGPANVCFCERFSE